MKEPPTDAGPLIVRAVQFTDEGEPMPRPTRGSATPIAGERLYVRLLTETPPVWVETTITVVTESSVVVRRDE